MAAAHVVEGGLRPQPTSSMGGLRASAAAARGALRGICYTRGAMPRLLLFVVSICAGLGCARCAPAPSAPHDPQLLSEMLTTLTQRQAKLNSYHLVVETREGANVASHHVYFRGPNKYRGDVSVPKALTLSFDGQRLYKASDDGPLEAYTLKLGAPEAALFLTNTFSPFIPEGFRTPLLPSKGVTAQKVAHPKGPEAVELTVAASDTVQVTYVLRHPTGELLEKRVRSGASVSRTVVEEEHCDAALKLCFPASQALEDDGQRVATVRASTIELNLDLPEAGFTLSPKPGETPVVKELTRADALP